MAKGYDARTATIKAMEEVTGPIVAITLVLCAVFVPVRLHQRHHRAVLPPVRRDDRRLDGHLGDQRRDHDAVAGRADLQEPKNGTGHGEQSTEALPWWIFGVLGGLVDALWLLAAATSLAALELAGYRPQGQLRRRCRIVAASPLLCFTRRAAVPAGCWAGSSIRPVNAVLGWLFRGFNCALRLDDRALWLDGRQAAALERRRAAGLWRPAGLTCWVSSRRPTGFIPQQDQGRLIVNIQLPDSVVAGAHRAKRRQRSTRSPATRPASRTRSPFAGMSFLLQANSPTSLRCSSCSIRSTSGKSRACATPRSWPSCAREWSEQVKDAKVTVFGASPIPGLGSAGGFKFMVEDRGGLGLDRLAGADRCSWSASCGAVPGLDDVRHAVSLEYAATAVSTSIAPRSRRWACRSRT